MPAHPEAHAHRPVSPEGVPLAQGSPVRRADLLFVGCLSVALALAWVRLMRQPPGGTAAASAAAAAYAPSRHPAGAVAACLAATIALVPLLFWAARKDSTGARRGCIVAAHRVLIIALFPEDVIQGAVLSRPPASGWAGALPTASAVLLGEAGQRCAAAALARRARLCPAAGTEPRCWASPAPQPCRQPRLPPAVVWSRHPAGSRAPPRHSDRLAGVGDAEPCRRVRSAGACAFPTWLASQHRPPALARRLCSPPLTVTLPSPLACRFSHRSCSTMS
jgi:hypothetical protein